MTGTFNNVVVPPGRDCELVDSDVRGNVIALEHSVFGIANSTVGGDIKGKKADATVPFRPKGIVKPIHLWKKPELAQATL